MIWFLSWLLAMALMTAVTVFYLWVLGGDPGMLGREVDRLAPGSWFWRPSSFTIPAIEILLYLFSAVLVSMRRRALRTKPPAELQEPSRITYVAQWLFANPAGAQLTLPFIPMIGIALLLSAPLLFTPNGLSSYAWGFALLFWITLIATAMFPDPPDLGETRRKPTAEADFVRRFATAPRRRSFERIRRTFSRS